MVNRLTVLLCERPAAQEFVDDTDPSFHSGRAAEFTEEIVGNLAGRPGIDLTLVAPLSEIQADSTDAMTLESISVDIAILMWQGADAIMSQLNRLQFRGFRSRHHSDSDAPTAQPGARRIYAFDLRNHEQVEPLLAEIERLRQVKSVKTFSLGMPPMNGEGSGVAKILPSTDFANQQDGVGGAADSVNTAMTASRRKSALSEPSGVSELGQGESGSTDLGMDKPKSKACGQLSGNQDRRQDEPLDLDGLLDQLDQSDV